MKRSGCWAGAEVTRSGCWAGAKVTRSACWARADLQLLPRGVKFRDAEFMQ